MSHMSHKHMSHQTIHYQFNRLKITKSGRELVRESVKESVRESVTESVTELTDLGVTQHDYSRL